MNSGFRGPNIRAAMMMKALRPITSPAEKAREDETLTVLSGTLYCAAMVLAARASSSLAG